MKLAYAIEQTAQAEAELAGLLIAVGERHSADQDVFHMTKTLANFSLSHVERLAPHAERYGAPKPHDGEAHPADEGPLLLLRDLRAIYLLASEASIDWVMLAQGAQAAGDTGLLDTVTACHAENLRTVKWATYRIKSAAPQALAAG